MQSSIYPVFQSKTYNEESAGQFIWAPKFNKNGKTMHYWGRLLCVREGDVIFHCSNGYIRAISKANGACQDSARPDSNTNDWTEWEKDGRRIDCSYHMLRSPLEYGAYKKKIQEYCNKKYAPFNRNGGGNQGYLFELNRDLALFFIQEVANKNPEILNLDYLKPILV